MKKFFLCCLILVIQLPLISQSGMIAYYHLNKEYITRVLCENRSRPELKCNGRCYLAKQLKAREDKKDRDTAEKVEKTPTLQIFFKPVESFVFEPCLNPENQQKSFPYLLVLTSPNGDGLFRPPRLAFYI